jgi:cation diffusion facilitator family transporter
VTAVSSAKSEHNFRLALGVCLVDLILTANAALMSNSLAILADLLKESTDTLSVLAAIFTLKLVQRPVSHRFSYGIGRLENLASILIGSLMLGSAILISVLAARQFSQPHQASGTLFGIGVFIFHGAIGAVVLWRTKRLLRDRQSALLSSQAKLWTAKTLYDFAMAGGLSLALIFGSQPWSWYIDPMASLVGVGLMLHAAWGMAASSVGDLLDASIEEATQLKIMRYLVAHIDDYERLHGILARRSGPRLFVEISLEFDPLWPMGKAQQRMDAIRCDIEEALPGARVSICPVASVS